MLTLTRKTEYALIAMTHLAHYPDQCNSAREIAAQYGMPLPLLMNILKLLNQHNLAKSVRGPRGGYTLAVPADQIALTDIIKAIEGPLHLVQCLGHEVSNNTNKKCEITPRCPVRSPIHRVHGRLVEFLSRITLAELADNTACCESVTPSIAESSST